MEEFTEDKWSTTKLRVWYDTAKKYSCCTTFIMLYVLSKSGIIAQLLYQDDSTLIWTMNKLYKPVKR